MMTSINITRLFLNQNINYLWFLLNILPGLGLLYQMTKLTAIDVFKEKIKIATGFENFFNVTPKIEILRNKVNYEYKITKSKIHIKILSNDKNYEIKDFEKLDSKKIEKLIKIDIDDRKEKSTKLQKIIFFLRISGIGIILLFTQPITTKMYVDWYGTSLQILMGAYFFLYFPLEIYYLFFYDEF
jgi:hypothetical protein